MAATCEAAERLECAWKRKRTLERGWKEQAAFATRVASKVTTKQTQQRQPLHEAKKKEGMRARGAPQQERLSKAQRIQLQVSSKSKAVCVHVTVTKVTTNSKQRGMEIFLVLMMRWLLFLLVGVAFLSSVERALWRYGLLPLHTSVCCVCVCVFVWV